jgi:hypothetical protein
VHRFPGGEARLPEQIVGSQTSSLDKKKQFAIPRNQFLWLWLFS